MNINVVEGARKQFAGKLKQRWGDLTSDDLKKIEGKRDEMVGLMQKKYGYTKQKAEKEIGQALAGYNDQLQGTAENMYDQVEQTMTKADEEVKQALNHYNDRVQETVDQLRDNVEQKATQVDQSVIENRWLAIAAAFGLGFIVAAIVRTKNKLASNDVKQ